MRSEIYFPGWAGKVVTVNGENYTLLEDPYCLEPLRSEYGFSPIEPCADAIGPGGKSYSVMWYIDVDEDTDFDALDLSDDLLSGVLEA